MLTVFLSVLIVYGLTLIVVQSSIFYGFRNWFTVRKLKAEAISSINVDDMAELFSNRSPFIRPELHQQYDELIEKIKANDADTPVFTQSVEDLKNVMAVGKADLLLLKGVSSAIYPIAKKFDKLFNCMMCMGFQNGILLTIITWLLNISLFNVSLVILPANIGFVSFLISVVLLGALFSGTTWGINAIIEWFERKDN